MDEFEITPELEREISEQAKLGVEKVVAETFFKHFKITEEEIWLFLDHTNLKEEVLYETICGIFKDRGIGPDMVSYIQWIKNQIAFASRGKENPPKMGTNEGIWVALKIGLFLALIVEVLRIFMGG